MVIEFLLIIVAETFAQQCYGVAFEGGGAKGAYEAGALSVLTDPSNNIFVQYDIMTGISIGALNTMVIGSFPVGQELQSSQKLNEFWFGIQNNSDLFVEWRGGIIEGVLFQKSIYNNARAIEYFRGYFKAPQRNVVVGATNLDTGLFQNFDQSLGNAFFDAAVSSASIPGAFPPHVMEGYAFADGGCILNLDIPSAIEYCLNKTGNQRLITIDILTDSYYQPLPSETSFKTTSVLERIYEIIKYDSSVWYLYNSFASFPSVNFRYFIYPSKPLHGSLDFNNTSIRDNYSLGVNDTLNAIKLNSECPREAIKRSLQKSIQVIHP